MTESSRHPTPAENLNLIVPEIARTEVEVLAPGPLSLIQDNGRRGAQHLGISVGGVADRHAAGWANRLLGNKPESALLEVCLGGLKLRFCNAQYFAISGADLHFTLNGRPLKNWGTYHAPAGSILCAGMAAEGVRGYIAFAGGIEVPEICGSRATTVAEGLGGIEGRALRTGDRMFCGATPSKQRPDIGIVRRVPETFQRNYSLGENDDPLELRVVPSNQYLQFPQVEIQRFFGATYTVSAAADRMGVRMVGGSLKNLPGNMISEPVCAGAIQIPADGQPIVLMPDCQTIGGYPKLGHVYRTDLDRLAQARPGTVICFALGDRAEAQSELLLQKRFFQSTGESQ